MSSLFLSLFDKNAASLPSKFKSDDRLGYHELFVKACISTWVLLSSWTTAVFPQGRLLRQGGGSQDYQGTPVIGVKLFNSDQYIFRLDKRVNFSTLGDDRVISKRTPFDTAVEFEYQWLAQ
jgi:hypothetical protein